MVKKRDYLNILVVVLIAILAINILTSSFAGKELSKKLDAKIEASKPVEISIIKITVDCPDCFNVDSIVSNLKSLNVNVTEEKVININEFEAKELASRYKIDKLPVLILSSDAKNYKTVTDVWNEVGSIEEDGSFVLRRINPPYKDLKTNEIKGLVKLTLLSDTSCKDCYDVTKQKLALERLRIFINNEQTIDIATKEGKALIETYKIIKVPTILLSQEAVDYPQFDLIWSSVGDVADDGTLVFRTVEVMGTYKDLSQNKIIKV